MKDTRHDLPQNGIARHTTLIILSLSTSDKDEHSKDFDLRSTNFGWSLHQLDGKNDFLHVDLHEVYMEIVLWGIPNRRRVKPASAGNRYNQAFSPT